jgi:hypothetical protein
MKANLTDPFELAKAFPIADLLPGWFFRIEERSAGVYEVEGVDLRRRSVRSEGSDPDRVLKECVAMARGITKANL